MVETSLTRGGVYLARLNSKTTDEINKVRPVILLTSQVILNSNPPLVFICPLSSKSKPLFSNLHIELKPRDNLKLNSFTLTEHCMAISIKRLIFPRLAQLTPTELQSVLEKLKTLLGLF
jgi:mRNA interferase MazF